MAILSHISVTRKVSLKILGNIIVHLSTFYHNEKYHFGKDGRSAEDLPGARSFWAGCTGCNDLIECTRGAIEITLGVQSLLTVSPRVHRCASKSNLELLVSYFTMKLN